MVRRPKGQGQPAESVYPYRYEGLTPKDSADDDEDRDERPRPRRRRPAARRPSYVAVYIAAAAVFGLFLVVGGGLTYYFLTNRRPQPQQVQFVPVPGPGFGNGMGGQPVIGVPAPAANPGELITLSNPRWMPGFGHFQVDYMYAGNQRPAGGLLTLVFQGPTLGGRTNHMPMFEARGTLNIHVIGAIGIGGQRGPLTIWIEDGGFGPAGRKVSNTVTLN